MKAADVMAALERSYSYEQGYLLIREITLAGSGTRRADAVALQLYRSRGIGLHGFEVKVDRRDWLRELKQAAKADELYRYCLTWTVVAPAGVVHLGEVPETWGLSEVGPKGNLSHTRRGQRLEPDPLDLVAVARLLRRAHAALTRPFDEKRHAALRAEYERGLADGRAGVDPEKYNRDRHRELIACVNAFEDTTGIGLRAASWHGEAGGRELGKAVKLVMQAPAHVASVRAELLRLSRGLARFAEEDVRVPPRFDDLVETMTPDEFFAEVVGIDPEQVSST